MSIISGIDKYVCSKYRNWNVTVALRYLPIVDDIRKGIVKKSNILDVGAGGPGIATYVNGYKITVADISFSDTRKGVVMVQASADRLPFNDNSFEGVVSVDMMEHLPPSLRKKSIYELVRVSRKKMYVAFPRGRISVFVDKLVSRYYKFTHGKELDFLEKEHKKYGLPEETEIIKFIKQAAKKYNKDVEIKSRGNTNVFLWLKLLFLGFSENKYLTRLYYWSNLLLPLFRKINFWPTYRTIILVKIKKDI